MVMTVKSLSYIETLGVVRNVFKDQDLTLLTDNPNLQDYYTIYRLYQTEQSDKFDYVPSRRGIFVLVVLKLIEIRLREGPGARFWAPQPRTLRMNDDEYTQVLYSWILSLR